MTTTANVQSTESSHWYSVAGEPVYEVPKADGKGMTPTTLRHARKMNLLPSVTTILRVLDKPALTAWKVEQAVLSVLTTPQLPQERIDEFIHRVLSVEKEQDAERYKAAQLGTDIHDGLASYFSGNGLAPYSNRLAYIAPVIEAIEASGAVVWCERVLIGSGYAGKSDLGMQRTTGCGDIYVDTIVDFKSCKNIPKECYPEHKMQLAAYAKCCGADKGFNIYISTTEPGKIAVLENDDMEGSYKSFMNLLSIWQWLNSYVPEQ